MNLNTTILKELGIPINGVLSYEVKGLPGEPLSVIVNYRVSSKQFTSISKKFEVSAKIIPERVRTKKPKMKRTKK